MCVCVCVFGVGADVCVCICVCMVSCQCSVCLASTAAFPLLLWWKQTRASISLMSMTLLCARRRTTFRYSSQCVQGGGEGRGEGDRIGWEGRVREREEDRRRDKEGERGEWKGREGGEGRGGEGGG